MCEIVNKEDVSEAREVFENWISKVRKVLKKDYKIHFACDIIGSGKRKLVIRQCNRNGFFDLDYQITLTRLPKELAENINNKAKDVKNIFRKTFDDNKPSDFTFCEDSTQALTIKSNDKKFGFDVIIIRIENDDKYILYNKKNTNTKCKGNNKDYCWEIRSDDLKFRDRMKKIKNADKWQFLRNSYRDKRHEYKDSVDGKKSFQILNEAVVNTLKEFHIDYK